MKQWPVAVLLLCAAATARADSTNVTTYDLLSKGLRVGHVRTERSRIERDGASFLRCEVTTDVHVNLLVYSYTLHSRQVSLTGEDGTIDYACDAVEDGVASSTRGRLENGTFHFDLASNGKTNAVDIARTAYDFTSLDSVELGLKLDAETKSWRILELQDAAVVPRMYTRVSDGIVSFEDVNRTAKRWIKEDDLGMVIVRQDGKDKAGSYSMRMTQ